MAASTISAMPRPPRLPGMTERNRSWLRRRNSSRSGGRDPPGGCDPEPHGPRDPEPHGPPPPDWLFHGIKSLLAPAKPAWFWGVIGEGSARYNAPSRRGAYISDKSKSGIVAGRRCTFIAGDFVPNPPIDRRKTRISVDRAVHIGNVQTGGQRHGLGINIGAAGDNDGVHAGAQRVAR